jgi:hypothetical protein
MLDERDERAWVDIQRRLGCDDAAGFFTIPLGPIARVTRSRWFPYLMAVAVPLLLPGICAVEVHPAVASLAGLVFAVVLFRQIRREAGVQRGGGAGPPRGTTSLERSEK